MWFEKTLKRFRKNSVCNKCNAPIQGNLLCEQCKEYVDAMEIKRKKEVEAKEELKRRSWIQTRDDFLKNKND